MLRSVSISISVTFLPGFRSILIEHDEFRQSSASRDSNILSFNFYVYIYKQTESSIITLYLLIDYRDSNYSLIIDKNSVTGKSKLHLHHDNLEIELNNYII